MINVFFSILVVRITRSKIIKFYFLVTRFEHQIVEVVILNQLQEGNYERWAHALLLFLNLDDLGCPHVFRIQPCESTID